jgi:hypothetical protein
MVQRAGLREENDLHPGTRRSKTLTAPDIATGTLVPPAALFIATPTGRASSCRSHDTASSASSDWDDGKLDARAEDWAAATPAENETTRAATHGPATATDTTRLGATATALPLERAVCERCRRQYGVRGERLCHGDRRQRQKQRLGLPCTATSSRGQKQRCICPCRSSPRTGGLSPRSRRDTQKGDVTRK